jgi:hypothetical protein
MLDAVFAGAFVSAVPTRDQRPTGAMNFTLLPIECLWKKWPIFALAATVPKSLK